MKYTESGYGLDIMECDIPAYYHHFEYNGRDIFVFVDGGKIIYTYIDDEEFVKFDGCYFTDVIRLIDRFSRLRIDNNILKEYDDEYWHGVKCRRALEFRDVYDIDDFLKCGCCGR